MWHFTLLWVQAAILARTVFLTAAFSACFIAFPALKADPETVLWTSILWVQQWWKSKESNSQSHVLLYHQQCITKCTEMTLVWSCWEVLNYSGSAPSFQYPLHFLHILCSFASTFSPRKSKLISDSPEPSESLYSLISFQPVEKSGIVSFAIHAFKFWSY